jgi:hypothetical protein
MQLRKLHSYSLNIIFGCLLILVSVTGEARGDRQKSSSSSGKSTGSTSTHATHSSGGSSHSGASHGSASHSTSSRTTSGHSTGSASTSHSSGHSSSPSVPAYTRKASSGDSGRRGGNHDGSTTSSHVNTGSGSHDHHIRNEERHVSGGSSALNNKHNDDHRGADSNFRRSSGPATHTGSGSTGHYEPVRHVSNIGGHRVYKDDHGRVRDIHARGVVIHHDLHGDRRFVAVHGGTRVVGYGPRRGFVERRYYTRPGRVYVQRTYVIGGRPYVYAYRSYRYRGIFFYRYAPAYYYRPAFYGWVYNPWPARVSFHWGWFGDPWYPYYGYYFRPYPYYASPSLWLTDYLLAENLRLAYEARANADAAAAASYSAQYPPPQSAEVALSPEVKQLVADEVQRQLEVERAAAEQPAPAVQQKAAPQNENAQVEDEVPPALDPNQIVFIVSSNLDLESDSGECSVTPGDVLMRVGNAPDENNRVAVKVASSKKGDCPVNTNSAVAVTDLQEMHNHFREKLDSGLKSLAENQGKNGLPSAPDTGTVAGEVPPAQPDTDAAKELEDEQNQADKTEREVQKAPPGQ